MGNYAENLKRKQESEALDALLNGETENNKIESLKEVLNLLSATDDGSTKLLNVVNTAITTAITTACAESGAIDTAISAKISAAIGEGGTIETWGDGRYAAKTT